MIQRNYKCWRTFNLIPKALKFRKNMAAQMVQKFVKGYIVFHTMYGKLRKSKIEANYEWFKEKREVIKQESAILIQNWWHATHRALLRKRAIEYEK